jgi:phosphate:Na+ symporter
MGMLGGLALFLFGMGQMTEALKAIAGNGLKRLLSRLTTNPLSGAFTGATLTAIIQSSSVTTVLLVGFVTAGLMTLPQSIGVIIGAKVGTTVTAQIVAFKVTDYALIPVTIGFALLFVGRGERIRQIGALLMGLGLIFFGMDLMSDAARPLRSYQPFIDQMRQLDNPVYGILVATVFTAIIQSSSATTGIIIVLAAQGFITLEAGIALVFGANIGTSATALLAAIGKPREAVRTAVAHTLFVIVGVALWFGFIDQLAAVVTQFSPQSPELDGIARLAAETPRQIANAHTLFNVANAAIFLWFAYPFAWLLKRIIPDRPKSGPEAVRPRYLSSVFLTTPALALDHARLELDYLGGFVKSMVRQAPEVVMEGDRAELDTLVSMDDTVDTLHGAIVTFLGRLSSENLSQEQARRLYALMGVANYLENIGDTIETNLVDIGRDRLRRDVTISRPTRDVIERLHAKIVWSIEQALLALADDDPDRAERVIALKPEVNALADEADQHLSHRLVADEADRLSLFRLETDIIENLKRLYYFAKRIAKIVVDDPASADARELHEVA